jgi:diguanylate cyclase (GGDEF)-like protein
MAASSDMRWGRSELYELICLLGIAECVWVIGVKLELFPFLNQLSLEYGLSSLVFLGFIMSFALVIASVRKSLRLRREMAFREMAESQAQTLARHDVLTGLPNRRLLIEKIEHLVRHPADDLSYAVLLVDLDRFKSVNDVHGHAAGDFVLCQAADRITDLLPEGAMAARLGGDEFSLLVPFEPGSDELMRLSQQIITRLSEPMEVAHTHVDIGATVGIALVRHDGNDPEELLRSADIAMYRGKRDGRGTYRFFEANMDRELRARVSLECELRSAIARGEVRPHYQPLVALPSQNLEGFEVLARWYHPTQGVLSPNVFIPIAEDSGLITELSYAILRQAAVDARSWPAHLRLAINISPHQFKDRQLAERLLAILAETGFPPERLEVEITESALTNDIELARATLKALQSVGVSIALDDFGTGYSSLSHLRELKFDKIKIDRSFVQSLKDQEESAKIVHAILGLGKSLGVMTTAEGIETKENLSWLAEQGCTNGQGYLFGAPMSANAVGHMLGKLADLPMPQLDKSEQASQQAAA